MRPPMMLWLWHKGVWYSPAGPPSQQGLRVKIARELSDPRPGIVVRDVLRAAAAAFRAPIGVIEETDDCIGKRMRIVFLHK